MNLKDLIKLKQLNLSEPIVRWLSAANKKELYWSGESRGDWLISVQKWLWKKQLEELKDVTYITIIADETFPSASDTRWVYHCQLADFEWVHMISIVSALIQINENNKDGSDTANDYATGFADEKFIYEVGIMKVILGHTKAFLKQTESRSLTFEKFLHVKIQPLFVLKKTLDEFNYNIYKQKIKAFRNVLPVIQQTFHSTRIVVLLVTTVLMIII
ncbi:unnamed protein product [Rotaria sp. Silwood2]|nr:unnamed protein product [Rotaria sp. Silwood2]